MKRKKLIKQLLHYDAELGIITWKINHTRAKAGIVAGWTTKDGYIRIRVNGKNYFAHRLAWFIYYGVWPKNDLDHINHKRADNRIINLRDVTRTVNLQNKRNKWILSLLEDFLKFELSFTEQQRSQYLESLKQILHK